MSTPSSFGQHTPPSPGGIPAPAMHPTRRKISDRLPGLVAVVLACLALLLGVVSAGFAWRASSKASEALKRVEALSAAPAQPRPGGVAAPEPESTTTAPFGSTPSDDNPTPDSSGSDPSLSPDTQFAVKYTDETLQVRVDCNSGVQVDLDEPRVRADPAIAEVRFYISCGATSPTVDLADGVRGSEVDATTVTPAECVDKIRLNPLPDGALPIRQGQVYCVNTSLNTAKANADSWRMVVMTITAVKDGVITLKTSAWNIPS